MIRSSSPAREQAERSAAASGEPPAERIGRLRMQARQIMTSAGWSNADAARRFDVSPSVFSEWMRNIYKGNSVAIADQIERGLAVVDAQLVSQSALIGEPRFVETSVARQVIQALTFAQTGPTMALITLGSGLGKTVALQWYQNSRAHAYRVAIEPVEGKARFMLRKIARVLGIPDQFRIADYAGKIAERLKRDGGRQPLLMIDEAQNLSDDAVNQLRFLLDEAQCGLALAGNEDLMARYSLSATREGYGQIHRRVGVRVHVKQAPTADVDLILQEIGVSDADMVRLAHQIAARPGGLGQVVDTFKLASMLAFGSGEALAAGHVKAAWQNRSREEIGR
jgi:DNA transposition AAA+ family ATPase